MIPYGRHDISEQDIAAVVEVLRSDWLTTGPMIEHFERALSDYTGAARAAAVSSGTAALHLACMALELGPQDRLWTSPISFVASANCARYCGARVDFVDIDPHSYTMSPTALEEKLTRAKKTGSLPSVVVPVHLAGQSCDMQAIHELGQRYGFRIIEDATHALGGHYLGAPVGSGRYSDLSVFSFHPVKIITSGEGGMVCGNDAELVGRVELLRNHGITRNPKNMTREPDGAWYYQQLELGYNYRLSDIQAALGVSQMHRLDEFVARRRTLFERYNALLDELPVTRPFQHPDNSSAHHLYIIQLPESVDQARVFDAMSARGIGVNLHYIPIHLQPYYRALGFNPGDFPHAEHYYKRAMTLPIYPTLTRSEQDRVIEALQQAVSG
jgi:UDP-4-amino-4,6-dideoxy-N-acetyl-beta-L-altrosamine transaminase